mgnify:CR=1 FL=1
MNERIKELHDKARQFYLQDEYLDLPLKQMHTLVEEKFADLIVRECAQFILVLDAEPVSHKSAARMLQEHFGVEE